MLIMDAFLLFLLLFLALILAEFMLSTLLPTPPNFRHSNRANSTYARNYLFHQVMQDDGFGVGPAH